MEVSLIESNIDLVASVARRFKEDDDLFQIGMIALWEATEKWDHVHPFRPWAKRVIRHRMIDHMRRKAPEEEELMDDVPAAETEIPESEAELRARIKKLFPKRSRGRRVLLLMVSGVEKEEIARRIQVSKRTVERIARKAYSQMQEEKRRE